MALFFTSCDSSEEKKSQAAAETENPEAILPTEPLPPAGETLFTKLPPASTGVTFQANLVLDHPMSRLYHSGFVCGGVAIADFDGDSRPDLFFANGPEKNRLFRQSGEFIFQDVSTSAGIDGGSSWATGATAIDFEADGDIDLYVCNYDSPNALYLNDGKGKFREAASEHGLAIIDASVMPTFSDYDRDGDLDVFILTNRYYREGGRPKDPPFEKTADGRVVVKAEFEQYYGLVQKAAGSYDMDEIGRPDILLRNDGGKFTDVSAAAGIQLNGHGLSATWWDFDSDGLIDIYITNDFADPDQLFRNKGDGTFTNVITSVVNYTPWFSMGADAGDVNNDGLLDFIALDMAATTHYKSKISMGEMGKMQFPIEQAKPRQVMRNCLYINSGTSRFYETAGLSGVSNSDWSWAAKLADFDNDGRVDLFISNGMARDFNNSDITFSPEDQIGHSEWHHYKDSPEKPEQNLAYKNRGNLEFGDASKDWGLDHVGMSYASAYGDLDRDGDLDLVVVNLDEAVSVYRNETKSGHWLTLKLEGQKLNREAIGAVVTLEAGGIKHVRQMVPMSGYLSNNLAELHFGLGTAEKIDTLTVRWPDGSLLTQTDVGIDQHLTINQAELPSANYTATAPEPMFRRFAGLRGILHTEKIYEDFVRQPLLPNKLSQLGPGIAFADVDGNGSEDFFIACPRGQSGAIFINDGTGKFNVTTDKPFDKDQQSEDMGVLFFDADSDGDADLYIASGSYEYDTGDPLTRDRLYLNDGTGTFSKAPGDALPDFRDNSSCVVAADFDRDGDLDLFVGGRVISGEYPLAANSRLLINESIPGSAVKFVEAPAECAPGLRTTGLVTSALWSDVDDDGWIDLLVTHEWGPIKVYKNSEGTLTDDTEASGLANLLGWWNSITGGDIDNDGDIDYAVGNVGLNTKYHASSGHPVQIFYGDYAGDGVKQLVEAKYEGDTLYPGRGKSCSTHAMPHLAQKFKTFHEFASAPLDKIYTLEKLSSADTFSATSLGSGILINDGSGKFTFQALPNEAQSAPIFGLSFSDVDGDGNLDLYAVQNFATTQFETPPFRGGLSVLLRGDGKGGLTPIPARESGLIVPSDGRGLTQTDFNGDGRPDFVVAVNNGELMAFSNSKSSGSRFRTLRLHGTGGNPTAVGARVIFQNGSAREIYQGAGYLSQSSPKLYFDDSVTSIRIRWPDGRESQHDLKGGENNVVIAYPASP
jgi:hypothetical protein